ncbi:MAG: signal peptide peptidase SppA [Planctomycetota bacterium]|nr:MAG: signal peptide peptidase SppA [Planctomycetota bacterium]
MSEQRTAIQTEGAPREQKKRGCLTPTNCLLFAVLGTGAFLLCLFAGLLVFASWGSGESSGGGGGGGGSGNVLRVVLDGPLGDAPQFAGAFLDPNDAPQPVARIARAIRDAAQDDDIDALYLRCGNVGAGWGVSRELREAVLAFRAAGKPAVAWAEGYDTKSYYVASACDQIALAPAGIALVNGFSVGITYFKRAFDKLGVEPEFEHVGDYKSAIEVYEREGPSAEASESLEYLLDGIWNQVLGEMAAQRKLRADVLQQRIDHPVLDPAGVVAAGLVDVAASRRAVEACLTTARDSNWLEQVGAAETALETQEPDFVDAEDYAGGWGGSGEKIALVYAEGAIVDSEGGGLFATNQISPGRYVRLLERLREDESVRALVLRVNSPGGSGLASDLIHEELERFHRTGRPIVVSMGDYAASGGYYIACGADWIVAQPTTITGSIGVFGGKFNLAGGLAKLGLTSHTYRRGEMSDMFDLDTPFDPERRAVFRTFLQSFYDRFVGKVAAGRKLELSAVHAIAKGRVWTGEQALERKLVDQVGGIEDALAKAAQLAHLERWHVVEQPRPLGLFETLMQEFDRQRHPSSAAALGSTQLGALIPSADVADALQEVLVLQQVLAGGRAAAYAPGLMPLR